ncbi:hypothetical protein Rhe02_54950 [Rhizocola hellebori]|uniref:Tail assembly chaperone n=1 Tax=Rhizocola hellebori TaxID=1392758 RepID=A0A8J3QAV2_9ACTN|nr:hypothetical protein [Rhizocola hellebori]GIH07428.1 hypothetical protein Rhe02_54950 [Rhizocola hellebori]
MAIELALDPKDQATYGGPEWVPLDLAGLDFIPFDVLDPLEHQMIRLWGIGLPRLIAEEMPEDTMRAKLGLIWLARKLAGVETPDLAEFKIHARRVAVRAGVKPAGDGGPPAKASSATSSEERASATGSSPSSPGSGKTRATNSRRVKSGN